MRINGLSLHNFRNYSKTDLDWSPRVNVITGPNGAGKTNLIDAIHYLCMTRSFVSGSDRYMVSEGEKYFMIEGRFAGEIRSDFTVACSYSRGEGKKIFVNSSPLERLSDLIGMVPVVVLSPEDLKLTSDGPAVRRAFIDGFISQISPVYLQTLIRYKHVRKQRNRLLQEFKGSLYSLKTMLEPWDMQLVETGSDIIAKRTSVLDTFRRYLTAQFISLSDIELKPDLEYRTFCRPDSSAAAIARNFEQELEQSLGKEVEREQTIVGPHRDEIVFYLGDMELRNYGSQGQHRIFSAALKLAQLFYYSEELDDFPVMLLDDVFGNLDKDKTDILLKTLQKHPGQTFITSASEEPFRDVKWSSEDGWYIVTDGRIEKKE